MKCRYCNAEIEQEAQFCPNCGKDLSKFNRCVKCGELLDDDTVFCPHCGTEQPHDEIEEAANSKKWIWILLPLLVVGGIGLWYFMSDGHSTNDNSAMVEAVDTDSIAVISTMAEAVDSDSIAVIDESDIDEDVVPLISIAKLRNTEIAKAIEKQSFFKTTITGHGGSETDIWYKNCTIGNRGEVKTKNDNTCVIEMFDGMGASVRITVFDKNVYEQIKTDVLKYSTKSNAGYCFKWGDDEEPTNSVINMGDSEWREGGYYIDIPLY